MASGTASLGSAPVSPEALEAARAWFRAEARIYPWTQTEDPYAIWISEIMLQQTVVTAAIGPFTAWMDRWPTLEALAAADEAEVLRAWEGLGYASRARNLHRAARQLIDRGQTVLPSTEAELRALPGVGEYTAAAILSFAFHQPALTLDANLKRVFQRLDAAPVWTPEVETRWRTLWASLVTGPTSRESNQAVMQLGQRVCRAKGPLCGSCPLAVMCRARSEGLTATIPASQPRSITEKATAVVFWTRPREGTEQWFLARPETGRFSNLWMAPPLPEETRPQKPLSPLSRRVHTYTRYRDQLTPWRGEWPDGDPPLPPGWTGRWATEAEVNSLGMVSVYRKIWEEAVAVARPRPGELEW